ncbi:flagellar hook-basal body protein [Tenuibacillus multivorans]|uniref:Flagellar basal-body rod protein FlgG n=1 Tax=Tenuibacillus multivorans TaxID=237069 RepID=A0A1G9X4K4_9BACI|nr:flagellar hook-basal body protein [Tenuibacillus multivorans]GEL77230.1 flagellar hook-basal body complex protein FlhP [Tenuibacillus multivorans]SDM91628.1 flagellar basal-body rod protein FlgG [Tenuibacillus multivorans]
MRNMLNAATTMGQLQQRIDLTSNNLANTDTYGYKSKQAQFSSLLFQQIDNMAGGDAESPRLTPEGIRVGSGARMAHTSMNLDVGTLQQTDRALDIAIQDANRFFVVNAPLENGESELRYTRAGNFYLQPVNDNEQVMLTTNQGVPVQGQDGPILIDGGFDDIGLNENGDVRVTRGDQTETEATLQVVDIERTRTLEAVGANTYRLDEAELGVPIADFVNDIAPQAANLHPGALESSNVDMAKEFTDLIEAQRAYSFNARSISMGDQMMGLIGSMRS